MSEKEILEAQLLGQFLSERNSPKFLNVLGEYLIEASKRKSDMLLINNKGFVRLADGSIKWRFTTDV